MAEFSTNPRTARVDMTPMVDLGFLLITFFMYTTTFTTPVVLKLNIPEKIDIHTDPPIMKAKNTLSLILGKDDKMYWHQEDLDKLNEFSLKQIDFEKSVRKLIIEKRNAAPNPEKYTVLIRPTDESNYKNAVDILDEMLITNQQRYVLADITPQEKKIYQSIIK